MYKINQVLFFGELTYLLQVKLKAGSVFIPVKILIYVLSKGHLLMAIDQTFKNCLTLL